MDPKLLLPRVCQLLTNTDVQRQECVRILREIMERGYFPVPREGMTRKTGEMLVRKGVLDKVRIEYCSRQYGKRTLKVYILKVETIQALYAVLQALKPPPVCI